MSGRKQRSAGFTLVEILVVITIMGVISATLIVAYPQARSQHKLTLAEQTLQAALREAQQATINEQRHKDCKIKVGDVTKERLCSDTGIVLNPSERMIIVFADIYEPTDNNFEDPDIIGLINSDFVLKRIPFPDGVQLEPATPPTTLIFEGAPPVIRLFTSSASCSTPPCEIKDSIPVTLSIGETTRALTIRSYGQVERL